MMTMPDLPPISDPLMILPPESGLVGFVDSLSGVELRRRLTQRGLAEDEARALVDHREHDRVKLYLEALLDT